MKQKIENETILEMILVTGYVRTILHITLLYMFHQRYMKTTNKLVLLH